ncbi:MAG: hypothetical protein HYS12_03135 [Planctomycetes bacterium]|nr:hypothetical protein [Planctomycetota bacterium]
MKKVTLGVFALSLVFLATGCGDSPDSVMKDGIKTANELFDVLEKIKTKEDAEKYKGDLEKAAKKMKDIEDRANKLKLKDLPEDKKKALQEKYKDDIEKLGKRAFGVLAALTNPEVQKVLKDAGMKEGGGADSIFGK